MSGKILLISLDGVRVIKKDVLTDKEIEYSEITDLNHFENTIRNEEPDALVMQVEEISEQKIKTIVGDGLLSNTPHLPWICLVMNNSSLGERLARANRVFYYGVGIEDLGFVLDAIKDAIKAGKQIKLADRFLRSKLEVSTTENTK